MFIGKGRAEENKCTRDGRLVREGLWVLHRLKLKIALLSGYARVSEAEGMCVMDRKEECLHVCIRKYLQQLLQNKGTFP